MDSSGMGSWCSSPQTPTLFIHPPRLVELATSGLTVTTLSVTSGSSRDMAVIIRPKVCWVAMLPV